MAKMHPTTARALILAPTDRRSVGTRVTRGGLMKIAGRLLLMAACLWALASCYGNSGALNDAGKDEANKEVFRTVTLARFADDGTLNYTGSGDFEGFSISASNPTLAGKTVYIEKVESEYFIDGYVSLSSKYDVRFTEDASDTVTPNLYNVSLTLPFSQSMLTAEGGGIEDVLVCNTTEGKVLPFDSLPAGTGVVTAEATIPSSFFSGLLKSIVIPEAGTIRIVGHSYMAAGENSEYLTDSNGVSHPDTARGIDRVQPGERVRLAVNQTAFGESISSADWSLSVPQGSVSSLVEDGDLREFIPDTVGVYEVTLELEGINGGKSEETIAIVAQSYSAAGGQGEATCLGACHGGNMASPEAQDPYGRQILRDLATPWRTTAHAGAFTQIAAVTYSGCLKCHATGFLFADRDEDGTDDFPAAAGFDDTISDWTAPAATGAAHLRGVTCEACHGPGTGAGSFDQSHYTTLPMSSDICLSCHQQESRSIHFFEYSVAHDQAHTEAGGNVANNVQCAECHTAEGMMNRIFSTGTALTNRDGITGIGCAVCHDPHGETGYESQLRVMGEYDIRLASGNLTVDAGKALICYHCHNADEELPAVGSIPHNSQAEMLNGVGGYDYGENLQAIGGIHSRQACSDCHMIHENGTTHDMNMTINAPERIAACAASPCHAATPPQFSDGHYDLNGNLTGVRAGIRQLADTINAKAGLPAGSAIKAAYSAESEELSTALNRAAYNYNFILNDRSNGFHNPVYAERLIALSLEDLDQY